MDIQAYIASGILELYALDQLSPPERAEVEANVLALPELQAELDEIERSLELFAQAQAMPAAPQLMDGIHAKIDAASPAVSAASASGASQAWRWLGGVLLLSLAAALLWSLMQSRQQQEQLSELQQQVTDCEQRAGAIDSLQQQIAFFSDPNSQFIELAGLPDHSDAQAAIVYNRDQSQTLFNPAGLPAIAADRQYQLWAIVGGATISLGVFDAPTAGNNAFLPVAHQANVDAFAITLEPRGGSIDPTLDQMYVIGQTS